MSFSDSYSWTYQQSPGGGAASTPSSGTITLTGDATNNLDMNVPANTAVNANVSVIKNNLQSLLITCDQNITLKTAGASFPQDTLTINGNVAYIWTVNLASVFACPFSANIISVQVNNTPSAAACNFKIRTVLNN